MAWTQGVGKCGEPSSNMQVANEVLDLRVQYRPGGVGLLLSISLKLKVTAKKREGVLW